MKKYILIFSTLLSFNAFADDNLQPTSGTCGTNCTWTMEGNTLTLTGYGNIDNQTRSAQPWYWNQENITSVVIQNTENTSGFKSIGQRVFEDMDYITMVRLPNTLETIGNEAFHGCHRLKDINLPDSLNTIGSWAFGYTSLSSITIPNSISRIEPSTFTNNTRLTDLVIPDGITYVSPSAFGGSSGYQSAAITNLYCNEAIADQCAAAVQWKKDLGQEVNVIPYQKYGNDFYYNGKFYASPNDIIGDHHIKKRIYTLDEANQVTGTKNRISIKYR